MSLVETDIGTIAPDWKVVPLKNVAKKPQYGLTTKAAKAGDTQFLRITDITDQGVNWATVPFCSAPKKKIDTCRLKSGDIVFARIGATTGKSYMITDPPDAVFASYLIRVRAGEELEPRFLIHFFQSRGYWEQVDANKHANLKKGVNGSILSELLIPLPPLPEQKKIAHILSTVQRAIEVQERIIQTTTELKKALTHKLLTEGLRGEPKKQTEIGLVPESWELVEIGDLGKCVTGSTPKTKVASFYNPPSEDFIAPADLGSRRYVYESEKKISPDGMATIRPLPKNAVLCVCIGSSIGKVGMSYREQSATNQQINSIICKIGRDPEFVYYLLSCRWEYWKSFSTFGPVPILSKGRFTSIAVAIPSSVEEQQAIAEPLIALETKIEVVEKKVAALNDLFRTLLHELMTAKTRVHEIEFSTPDS